MKIGTIRFARVRAGRASATASGAGIAAWLLLAVCVGGSSSTQACATCGCTLNADAASGYSPLAGWRLGLEYDYLDQNQLRSGTAAAHTVPQGQELEHETLNRYTTASLTYNPTSRWSLMVLVPWVERQHTTYGSYDPGVPQQLSGSSSSTLGDMRLLTSYQGLLPTRNLGVQLGVKLPSGRYGTAVNFDRGPLAGTPLDASLQPGTGSTDLIVGAYYFQALSRDFDAYATAQFQSALRHHLDQPGTDYRPGNALTASIGLRLLHFASILPQLQINLLHKSADQGALADAADTAGSVVFVSPGATLQASASLHLYGFLQLPVYSNLSGYQLFPRYTLTLGMRYDL